MEFHDVVRKRRMVRSFSDAPVDPQALSRILDTARRGPSAGYSQGVEFVLVTDPAVRIALAPPSDDLRAASVRGFTDQAPALIVVCTSAGRYIARYHEADKAKVRDGWSDDEWWHVPYWHADAGAAMMLILLAAVNERLGAGVVGVMGSEGQQRIRRAIGMPEDYEAIVIIAVGYEAPDARPRSGSSATRPRRPIDDIVHHNRW
jgi:nitroreductase